MLFVVAATLASTFLSAFFAGIASRLARAQVWSDLGRLWPVGAVTAIFGALDLATIVAATPWLVAFFARLQLAAALLLSLAWLRYAAVDPGGSSPRAARPIGYAFLAAMVLALFPGMAIDGRPLPFHEAHNSAWTHAALTPVGHALVLVALAGAVASMALLLRRWRQGDRPAATVALSFGAALVVAMVEYLIRADALAGPHLLASAAGIPVAAAAWVLGVRFVADAEDLHALRARLEGLVESRTRDLAETHAALLQAEKLAALGQFAAGVAHEVNNPASVVTANLSHLATTPADAMTGEAREIVGESLDAMRRINDLVRKLLDAGRLADLPPGTGTVALARAASIAIEEVRPRTRGDVEVLNRIPDDLLVRGGDEVLQRILNSLLSNALDSIPVGRSGRVEVTARTDGPNVLVLIQDNGVGMETDALRRAFDPFFTTKQVGRGSGLGLPITRGLVEGIGGQIWLESEPGKGTCAVVELPPGKPG